ncbi:unnamed protein product [Durusdinium trenchii]
MVATPSKLELLVQATVLQVPLLACKAHNGHQVNPHGLSSLRLQAQEAGTERAASDGKRALRHRSALEITPYQRQPSLGPLSTLSRSTLIIHHQVQKKKQTVQVPSSFLGLPEWLLALRAT